MEKKKKSKPFDKFEYSISILIMYLKLHKGIDLFEEKLSFKDAKKKRKEK